MTAKQDSLIPAQPQPVAQVPPAEAADYSPGQLLKLAIEGKVDVSVVERLHDLYRQAQDRQAEQELNEALAAFQQECPPIPRARTATITSKSGGSWSYKYADLETIKAVTDPIANRHGLSISHDSRLEGQTFTVLGYLRHIGGATRTSTFSAPLDSSGRVSAAQECAKVLTFGMRQTRIQLLGLTTCDPDDDAAPDPRALEPIARADIEAIERKLADLLPEDRPAFLEFMRVESVADITNGDLARAMQALAAKARQRAKGGK